MKKLFRCMLCEREFEADKPGCESCGLDPAKNPRDAEKVHEIARIHFDPPGKYEGRGLNHAACDPKLKVGGKRGHHFSGETAAVTCPQCKETEAFKNPGEIGVAKELAEVVPVPMEEVAKQAEAAERESEA